jgi:hypothetical protein
VDFEIAVDEPHGALQDAGVACDDGAADRADLGFGQSHGDDFRADAGRVAHGDSDDWFNVHLKQGQSDRSAGGAWYGRTGRALPEALSSGQALAESAALEKPGGEDIRLMLELLDLRPAIGDRGVEYGTIELWVQMGAAGNQADAAMLEAVSEMGAVSEEDGESVAAAGDSEQFGDSRRVAGGVFEGDDVGVSAQAVDRIDWNRLMGGRGNVVENQRPGDWSARREK